MKYNYDQEADILSVMIKNKPFDYASEMGDFVVHFSTDNKPVYIEILNASKFLSSASEILPKNHKHQLGM